MTVIGMCAFRAERFYVGMEGKPDTVERLKSAKSLLLL